MKRFLICLFCAALPLQAAASTDLARQWGAEASRLSLETSELIFAVDRGEPMDLTDRFTLDIYRFGRTSADLAHWVDSSSGPHDLGCIFRGMAAESEEQLLILDSEAALTEQRESLRRLASMFSDAELIAVAAQRRAPMPGLASVKPTSTCSADAAQALKVLR